MHAERHAYGMAGMEHSAKRSVKRSLLKAESFYQSVKIKTLPYR